MYWEAESLSRETGQIRDDPHASNGRVVEAVAGRDRPGFVVFGPYRLLPAGAFRAVFRLRGDDGPVRGPGHGVGGDGPQVPLLQQGLQGLGVLALVGVVLVDAVAELEQVLAKHRLLGLDDGGLVVRQRDGGQDRDERHHRDQLEEREPPLGGSSRNHAHQSL